MKKRAFIIFFAILLIIFFTNISYPQKSLRKGSSGNLHKKDTARSYQERIADYWDHRIVNCGDSSYLFRLNQKRERDLFEVKGVTFETSGEMVSRSAPGKKETSEDIEYPRNVEWNGSSTARFESYRRFISRGSWEDWKAGVSEFSYFQGYKGSLFHTPEWIPFTSCSEVESFTKRLAVGMMLPGIITHIQIEDIDGRTFTLEDYKDKVVLINLWATWCGPCRLEMPNLVDLQNKYKDKGLIIIGLDVDPDDVDVVKAFRKSNGLNYTLAVLNRELYSELLGISQAGFIPQTFLIDKGRLAGVFKGYDSSGAKAKRELNRLSH